MAVGLPDSLDSLLDSAPPVHEVCEHVRVTNWYQLGIQLLLDGVELEEIRKDADKRDRIYNYNYICNCNNVQCIGLVSDIYMIYYIFVIIIVTYCCDMHVINTTVIYTMYILQFLLS